MAALAEFVKPEVSSVSVREDRLSLAGLPMPVTLRLTRPLTDDELIEFSVENQLFQIERNAEGELEIMSPHGFDGAWRDLFPARILANWADVHGGVSLGSSAGFRLDDTAVRSPDGAWISDARVATLTAEQKRRYVPFAPDFLIEVLSENDSRRLLEKKMKMWMDFGAQLAWMIDPYKAHVLIYRPGAEPEVLERPDWVEADSVVTGFRLETARMWEKS